MDVSVITTTEHYMLGILMLERTVRVYKVAVKIIDEYDFDIKEWSGIGNIMNNIAAVAHNRWGVGNDYGWTATFTVHQKIENNPLYA